MEQQIHRQDQQTSSLVNIQDIASYLGEQQDVIAAYLFGSVARHQASASSDVDIAILFTSGLVPLDMVERQLQLMVALDNYADREVQITVLNTAPPLLVYQVIREGILVYERDQLKRISFEVHGLKIYFDLKPMFELYTQALLRQIQEGDLGRRTDRHTGALEAARRIHKRLAGPIAGYLQNSQAD
jgi:predicted nucleotidyltransferase